jgi:uncharacterized protein HemX
MSKLQFKTQSDCDKFIQRAKKASESAQVKRKPIHAADDCVERLQAKIKRLEMQNEGLVKRLMELQANYDGLMIAYSLLRDTTTDKPNVYEDCEN